MTLLSDQLSAARQSQWETQLDMLRTLSTRVLDSTEQLIALNMKTSRASMEQATGTFKQILEVTNPRDLYALGSVAQGQWQHMFAYSRELLGIAAGARAHAWIGQPAAAPLAPAVPVVPALAHIDDQVAIAAADAATLPSELIAAALDSDLALAEATLQAGIEDLHDAAPAPAPDVTEVTEVTELDAETAGATPSEAPAEAPADATEAAVTDAAATEAAAPAQPEAAAADAEAAIEITVPPEAIVDALVDQALIDAAPPAKVKPLAKALKELAPQLAGAEHPIASTVPLESEGDIALPPIAPVDNTAPPQQLTRAAPEPRSPRASRKK